MARMINLNLPNNEQHRITVVRDNEGNNVLYLDFSNELAGILFTLFSAVRRADNSSGTHQKYLSLDAKLLETPLKIADLETQWRATGVKFNFTIATPIVNMLTAFKCMFDEVRTGVTTFQYKKASQAGKKRTHAGQILRKKEDRSNITEYGLNNQHIPLLKGITLPPERRSGLIRSVGPLAHAIFLVNETKFTNKIAKSFSETIQIIPAKGEIVNALEACKNGAEASSILTELGDLLLLSTARSTQKIDFPLTLAMWLFSAKGDNPWNFSGPGTMYLLDQGIKNLSLKFKIRSQEDVTRNIAQVIFHAMYGTYTEDFGILSQITTEAEWKKRKDVDKVFKERSKAEYRRVTPVRFIYYSKLAQSLLTKSLGNTDPCFTRLPSFSANRTRLFTTEFKTYLATGKVGAQAGRGFNISYYLRSLRDELVQKMEVGKLEECGTRKWMKEKEGKLVEVDDRFMENCRCFFGK
ncbi:hypothetical protein HHI36_001434 [Cryptolaemus montrouzieri]|uniref:Nucleocapsid protein n=1 Tax=Cryptolaemus montrouzieri TaxID=559131 RepID=A0ABD2P7N5_9CUCU